MAVPSAISIPNSPFETIGIVSDGITGTAPTIYVASTVSSLSAMLAAGFLNPLGKFIKANDIFFINYSDASTFPLDTGESALLGEFIVQYDPTLGNYNLIPTNLPVNTIASMGVHSATFSNPGGSATTVVSDPAISPNSVVIARWQSSVTAAIIKTVLPGNGTLTVVSSTDPGVSVLEYISILPNVPLQNAGVYAAQYTNAGGSATITIANANITSSMVVTANFLSQTNSAEIKTVIAAAGTITIVATADPGASVIEYVAAAPSTALTALGFYAASAVNAGGSATTTVTDANITPSSIVVADWASQTNAVEIEKVTPGSGSLVIVSSADPGASVLNYQATPAAEGNAGGAFLPLAGGQMTGSILLDRGTATSTAAAATINHQAGVITTEALTTASGSEYAFTLTNSRITASSIVLCQLMGGTNTRHGLAFTATPSAGSCAISVLNNDIAAAALNGTLIFGFVVI